MEETRRRRLAEQALAGYVNGPDAPVEATAAALEQVDSARCVVLVEGISDRMALDALAARTGLDVTAEAIVIVPIGGAHAATKYLARFTAEPDLRVVGICDEGEEQFIRDGLEAVGLGPVRTRAELEHAGFYVCVRDLEDELLRAAGPDVIEALLADQEDLGSFRTMQKQPAWRDRGFDDQIRRFLGAGARRKLRYARLLTEVIKLDAMPRPLVAVLAAASAPEAD